LTPATRRTSPASDAPKPRRTTEPFRADHFHCSLTVPQFTPPHSLIHTVPFSPQKPPHCQCFALVIPGTWVTPTTHSLCPRTASAPRAPFTNPDCHSPALPPHCAHTPTLPRMACVTLCGNLFCLQGSARPSAAPARSWGEIGFGFRPQTDCFRIRVPFGSAHRFHSVPFGCLSKCSPPTTSESESSCTTGLRSVA
jgi:hypothetical protein